MSWWDVVKSWFHKQEHTVDTLLHKIFPESTVASIEGTAKNILSTALGQVALNAVKSYESNSSLSGSAKAAAVAEEIAKSAEAAGLQAGSSTMNYLIETAVLAVKHFVPEPAAPPATPPAEQPA